MLPNQQLLEQINQKIKHIPNRQKESKRRIHYGLFLLGYKSGLRVSEAISFDLSEKNKYGLYRITKPKGKKERYVYIPKKVIRELKKSNWRPNQTNRFNFYHFLRKIKRELNISREIELSPHTLRRAFTTYHAEAGLPLPLLQKLLGHSSIRTTALYWRNIHQEPDNDIADILAGKKWLEDKKEPPKLPTTENFPEILKFLKPVILSDNPKSTKKPIIKQTLPLFTKQKPLIQPKPHEQEILTKITDQQSINRQQLTLISNQEEQSTSKEQILLEKIKNLEEQLAQVQAENNYLKLENKHFKALINQDQERTEAKIIQPLSFKFNK